jgi:hypothetical protein
MKIAEILADRQIIAETILFAMRQIERDDAVAAWQDCQQSRGF